MVVSSVFALTHVVFSNPQVSLFGAFGSFALLLLVDFPGRPRTRAVSYGGLVVVATGFIAVGTVVSSHKAAAIAVMAVVGFGVLFAGIVSPQAATASTAALLTFVLPVAVVQPASAVGPRLLGWAFAVATCVPACLLVWPTPWHDDLRRRLSATVSAVARLSLTVAGGRSDPEACGVVRRELARLRDEYAGTPYPPTGTASAAVGLAKLVGRVEWVASNALLAHDRAGSSDLSPVRALVEAVGRTLQLSASLISDGEAHPVDDGARVRSLQESIRRLDALIAHQLDADVNMLIDPEPDGVEPATASGSDADGFDQHGIASWLDPSFRARAMGIATEMMADAALESAGAQTVGDRRLGPPGQPPIHTTWRRILSHLSFRSVWFRNAVRGGAGLALAVAVVEFTDVEHGFWVVLGTLSVLRSNALGTGATALRAVGGTAVGFVIGSAIMVGVAAHPVLLWVLLPLSVLVSGTAPSMISFAAGQAGFTVVVIILFNIIAPAGWKVGLTRIEDVAIGCAVSIVVGVLFWPRGATAALGRALSDAFVASSSYLADAVDRLTTPAGQVDTRPGQRAAHDAYLRLDDAFREFLTERGAKVVPVDTVTDLLTGSNRIRMAAYTLSILRALAPEPGQPELESVEVAGAVLRDSYASSQRWYEEFAEVLADRRDSLDPPPAHNQILHQVLLEAFEDARSRRRGDRLRTTLQMLWADELLETQSQVQVDLAGAATLFARRRRHQLMN
ncbi:MAG TPA: FUSC family protein [Acidimicrobiales bacterium]|nr:FUSC family protein [Acidimicrobiales bacterium]